MPLYKEDGTPVTVSEMAPTASSNTTFADYDAAEDKVNPYAVEGNDLSNFKGVSEEYRTYASEVDSPLDFDATVADNSAEKLEALGVEVDDESTVLTGGAAESSADRNEAAQDEKQSIVDASVEREENEPSAPDEVTDSPVENADKSAPSDGTPAAKPAPTPFPTS